jgi:hypothetical protein
MEHQMNKYQITALALLTVPLMFETSEGAEQHAPLGSLQNSCVATRRSKLTVNLRRQQARQWCWAASAQMVMEYLGKVISQCDQVNKQLMRNDCCSDSIPDDCDLTGWPEFGEYGFDYHKTDEAALSWEEVKAQLADNPCRFTPFAFSWKSYGGGGHMMVATGYYIDPDTGKRTIEVNDPEQKIARVTYEEYVGLNENTHWDDFYDITMK